MMPINIYKFTSVKVLTFGISVLWLNHSTIAQAQLPYLLAQTVPAIPPGIIEPTQPVPPLVPETLPTPPPTPQIEPTQPVPTQPFPEIETKIKVKKVEVLGSSVFSAEELAAVVAPFVDQEATFEQLLEIRTAITNLYTSNGYTTSGAFLPPQDISDGAIQIQVVEGELERVEVQGLNRLQKSYVQQRIALAAKTPVNIRRLESALQLLQLNPLFNRVQAELIAGTAPGQNVLIINLQEAPPLTSGLIVDNRESPSVGSLRGAAALSHNNLLGFGDRLSAEVGITEGVRDYNFNYEFPVNARNGTLNFRYSNGRNRITAQRFTLLGIRGRSETYSLGFRQPIARTANTEFALSLSGDLRRSQTYIQDDEPYSFTTGPEKGESKVSVIRFSQDWVNRNSHRVLAARSQLSLGLGVLGATVNDSGTDGRFLSWLGQFQWVQALNQQKDASLIANVATQITGDSLLPLEQFSIGGVDTVRGYRTNQQVGDSGIFGSVEVNLPVVRDLDGFGLLQVAPFIDAGTVWDHNDGASSRVLVGAGLGLRWQLSSRVLATLDWGIPLVPAAKEDDSLQDNGIYFSLRVQPF